MADVTPKSEAPKPLKTVKVRTTGNPVRTLFEGPVDAAKKYVEDNFPRVHVNPQNPADEPTPDVVLSSGAGGADMYYWGPEEGWENS